MGVVSTRSILPAAGINGTTAIGSWHSQVTAAGRRIGSVRQSPRMPIYGGRPASTLESRAVSS